MTSRRTWSVFEEAVLRLLYADMKTQFFADLFGRRPSQVYAYANKLGLKKSPAFLASALAGRLRRGAGVGRNTRFRKGDVPHNAGKKGWQAGGRARETQFKKGERSGAAARNWQPIGHERICGGYLQRKITDTGYTPGDYVEVHRLLWAEHHGPIPAGHIVTFKNRDRADIRIENLELISRAENARRNSIHRYPPELKHTIRVAAKLRRTIQKRAEA